MFFFSSHNVRILTQSEVLHFRCDVNCVSEQTETRHSYTNYTSDHWT